MKKTTHFGFKEVLTQDKAHLVRDVFDSVANKYDLMNDVLSFGFHRLWKDRTIALSGIKPGDSVLDIAGGTGDLSLRFKQKVGIDGRVVLADINAKMLQAGRDKLLDENGEVAIEFVQTNAESLAFKDNSFDVVSIAFGLRNVTDKEQALIETLRVLKPGGSLLVLEFSQSDNALLGNAYDFYSFNVMPKLGGLIAGDSESYQYLAESIRQHPDQESLKEMILTAGFANCSYYNFMQGIVALHKATKAIKTDDKS